VSGVASLLPGRFGCGTLTLTLVCEHAPRAAKAEQALPPPISSPGSGLDAVVRAARATRDSIADKLHGLPSRGSVASVGGAARDGTARAARATRAGIAGALGAARDGLLSPGGGGEPEAVGVEVACAVLQYVGGVAPRLHERFARYEEVDGAEMEHFKKEGVPNAVASNRQEAALVRSGEIPRPRTAPARPRVTPLTH
jgi:hypothetical protein